MRITGGKHRSRALRAPRGSATRPTSDRVREALFGILVAQGRVEGARVLDLYAGTGALALEALSRGAACATLVEKGRDALDAIRSNVEALGVGRAVTVLGAPVDRAAKGFEPRAFDLVLVDPPYADVTSGAAVRLLEDVVERGALAEDALIVLEHGTPRGPAGAAGPEVAGLERLETRRYGDTCLSFYVPLAGNPLYTGRREQG
jgi:16S rRNA (guanine966-N2)-methyltransferase